MLTVEGDGAGLTVATRAVWAKSRIDERGELTAWLPLHEHLADAADAAELLWDRWMGEQRRRVIEVAVGDPEQARRLAIFLAAVHDVGKATLPFAAKVPRLGDQMVAHGFTFPFRPTADDQRALPHGLAGQIIVERYLCNRGWARAAASQLGSVVGGHHGIPPSLGQVQHARTRSDLLGDDVWLRAQDELLDAAVRRSGVDLDALRARGLGSPALVLLTGLVIVADWLASNETLFQRHAFNLMVNTFRCGDPQTVGSRHLDQDVLLADREKVQRRTGVEQDAHEAGPGAPPGNN